MCASSASAGLIGASSVGAGAAVLSSGSVGFTTSNLRREIREQSLATTSHANTLVAMPEGDTIYRAAAALRTALIGKKMLRFEAARLDGIAPRVGQTIEEVRSRGKHLEIVWDDGVVLHTHMRMTGSWHMYRIGERWRKPPHRARVVIGVADWVAVCFSAPVVEAYRDFDRARHPILGRLGPDLCHEAPDLEECARRMQGYEPAETSIAEVLLDQRVMCGVGNVYR